MFTVQNDLVIDDDIESETVLGEGKAGLLEHQDGDMNPTSSLNRSKGKMRGMSGPISSNLDVSTSLNMCEKDAFLNVGYKVL